MTAAINVSGIVVDNFPCGSVLGLSFRSALVACTKIYMRRRSRISLPVAPIDREEDRASLTFVTERCLEKLQDFALIRSKGDQALFGRSTQAMKAQWKVPDTRPLADFAPTIILKAKDFATEITIFNARAHTMKTERQISNEHVTNNKAVRQTLIDRGIRPENLLPEEDIKKVERRVASQYRKTLARPEKLED